MKTGLGGLIMNLLLVGAVSLVTLQAGMEKNGSSGAPVWAPAPAPSSVTPVPAPLQPAPVSQSVGGEVWDLPRIAAALSAYVANLDGTLTDQEIQRISREVGTAWKGQTDSFLVDLQNQFKSGKMEDVAKKALNDLNNSPQKVQAMAWLAQSLKDQGWTWEDIQKTTGRWTQEVLGIRQVDFWGALKKD